MEPLEKQLEKKKIELSDLESKVKEKKSELGNFNTELKKIKKDIGTASNKLGGSKKDVGFEPSPILLVALIISLSLNLFAISQLGNIGLLQKRSEIKLKLIIIIIVKILGMTQNLLIICT